MRTITCLAVVLPLTGIVLPVARIEGQSREVVVLRSTTGVRPETGSVLLRPAGLAVDNMPLATALTRLSETSKVSIAFSPSFLPQGHRVNCRCETVTVATALDYLLGGTNFGYVVLDDQVLVSPKPSIKADDRYVPTAALGAVTLDAGIRLAASALPGFLTAQDRTAISGTVTDAATGQPLADVRISVVDAALQSVSDGRGLYRLTGVPVGQVMIQARRIGYRAMDRSVTVPASHPLTVDLALTPSVVTLNEMIVSGTAGDLTRKAQSATVAEIGVSDIAATTPARTLDQVLQSRVPGVSVNAGSGASGTTSEIRIRGAASISLSNEPLIYVDGIRVTSQASPLFFTASFFLGGQVPSRLSEFDPKEIESIEVVKGPAAATLYGADASAGVINIITKKGPAGSRRFTQSIGAEYQHIDPNFVPPANYDRCTAPLVAPTSPNPLCRGKAVGELVSDNPLVREGVFRNGSTKALSWSGSGGGPTFGVFLFGAYETEDGTLPNNGFDRRSGRANFTWTPASKFTVDVNAGLHRANISLPNNNDDGHGYLAATIGTPLTRRDDGVDGPNGWFKPDGAAIALIENTQQTHRVTTSLSATFAPWPWFTHRVTTGADWGRDEMLRYLPKNSRSSYFGSNTGDLNVARAGFERYTFDYLGNARIPTGSTIVHNLSAGFQVVSSRQELLQASGVGFSVNSNNLVGAAAAKGADQSYFLQRQVGFLGQWQGSYRDRLFVQLGARLDANSAFGDVADWFFLPKAGISYVVSEEPWWQRQIGFVNTLRLRLAYGQTGRAPNAGAALRTLASAPYVTILGTQQPGVVPLSPGNDSLKAERGVEFEAGFDAGFFNDRAGIEFTFYNKVSRDLLLQRPLSPSLGFSQTPFVNIGELSNRGVEVAFTAQPILGKTVSWDVRVGLSTLDSEIRDMGGVAPFLTAGGANRVMVGYQPGVFIGNRIRSIDVASKRVIVSDTAEVIGNTMPTIEGNVSTNLTLFSRLRLYALLDGKAGYYNYNLNDLFRENSLIRSNLRLDPTALSPEERLRRFGDETPGRPPFVRENGTPATINEVRDAYVQKADFLRLREVSATLTVPASWAAYIRAQGATITVAGQNLALWTKYGGVDPEVISSTRSGGSDAFNIFDFLGLPPTRRAVVRVNLQY